MLSKMVETAACSGSKPQKILKAWQLSKGSLASCVESGKSLASWEKPEPRANPLARSIKDVTEGEQIFFLCSIGMTHKPIYSKCYILPWIERWIMGKLDGNISSWHETSNTLHHSSFYAVTDIINSSNVTHGVFCSLLLLLLFCFIFCFVLGGIDSAILNRVNNLSILFYLVL